MRPLTPEQLLAVADEFCPAFSVQVRSFSCLVACASVPGARVHGIPVFDSIEPASRALENAIVRLEPLTGANERFARFAADVYRQWAEAA